MFTRRSTRVFTAASFVITQTWKLPKCPSTEEYIMANSHNEILQWEWMINYYRAIWNNLWGWKWPHTKENMMYNSTYIIHKKRQKKSLLGVKIAVALIGAYLMNGMEPKTHGAFWYRCRLHLYVQFLKFQWLICLW